MFSVLQITDCHLVVEGAQLIGVDTQMSLEAVLAEATRTQVPDAIIASGDLAHDPEPKVYERFHRTVRQFSEAPLICTPGNHDVVDAMSTLPMQGLALGNWAIIALDSHEDESTPARITIEDRDRTEGEIAQSDAEHILVTAHHPLVEVDAPWLDRDRVQQPEELVDWLQQCSQGRVRAIVFGHAHQEVTGTCRDLPVYGAPSTCFQFKPHSQKFTLDTLTPGYRWLTLHDQGRLTTQVGRVEHFKIEPKLR